MGEKDRAMVRGQENAELPKSHTSPDVSINSGLYIWWLSLIVIGPGDVAAISVCACPLSDIYTMMKLSSITQVVSPQLSNTCLDLNFHLWMHKIDVTSPWGIFLNQKNILMWLLIVNVGFSPNIYKTAFLTFPCITSVSKIAFFISSKFLHLPWKLRCFL